MTYPRNLDMLIRRGDYANLHVSLRLSGNETWDFLLEMPYTAVNHRGLTAVYGFLCFLSHNKDTVFPYGI